MKKRLKINGYIMVCAFLLAVAFPEAFFRDSKITADFAFGRFVEIPGFAFILLGQLFRASSRGYKSEYSGQGNVLIKGGPYSLVRNPMYLGILLIGLGIVAMLFKWWVITIFLLIFIARYVLLIFKEEKKLKSKFPAKYRDYQQKVPRIMPSINMLFRREISEYLPIKPLWVRKEIGSMAALLFLALLLKLWQSIRQQGGAIYFNELAAFLATTILFICLVVYLNRRTANLDKKCFK